MAGGFHFKKWISNQDAVLKLIPTLHQVNITNVPIKDNVVHALGIMLNPSMDNLHFKITSLEPPSIRNQAVSSNITQFFDLLELLSPVFII